MENRTHICQCCNSSINWARTINWSNIANTGWYGTVLVDHYVHRVRTPFGIYNYWKPFPVRVSTLPERWKKLREKQDKIIKLLNLEKD